MIASKQLSEVSEPLLACVIARVHAVEVFNVWISVQLHQKVNNLVFSFADEVAERCPSLPVVSVDVPAAVYQLGREVELVCVQDFH